MHEQLRNKKKSERKYSISGTKREKKLPNT